MMCEFARRQFFHDRLEAFFELAAILGAGDDQRDVENASSRLSAQEMRDGRRRQRFWARPSTMAVLPTPGFADQHRRCSWSGAHSTWMHALQSR